VASGTADAFVDVNAVVEVYEVRQVVDASPLKWFVVAKTGSDGLQERAVRPNLGVAAHARLRRRNFSERRHLDGGMAVPAVDSESSYVMLVTKGNRLFPGCADLGYVG
jgi:hypothetical protein